MFKLKARGQLYRDGSFYDVDLGRTKYAVGTFIYEILQHRKDEWGTVRIVQHGVDRTFWPKIEYSYGEIVGATGITEELLFTEVDSVDAFGGWTAMDYSIYRKIS